MTSKKIVAIFCLFIMTSSAWSKCNTDNIGYYKQSGFGISFSGGGSKAGFYDKQTTNVPLSINNEPACFKKTNSFSLKAESKKNAEEKNKIIISPMKVEFENIPSAHHKQYIFVEKNSNAALTKFHTMSFVCAGEIPLSIEALSDSVAIITAKTATAEIGVRTYFATGTAAENLHKAAEKKTKAHETFDFFSKIYKEKTIKELDQSIPCCSDHSIPSILSDTSINALSGTERTIVSSFTTMASNVPNGCSNDFAETMGHYQIENFEKNESLKGFTVKKKWFSADLEFELN